LSLPRMKNSLVFQPETQPLYQLSCPGCLINWLCVKLLINPAFIWVRPQETTETWQPQRILLQVVPTSDWARYFKQTDSFTLSCQHQLEVSSVTLYLTYWMCATRKISTGCTSLIWNSIILHHP
jgi:hypothetical protein